MISSFAAPMYQVLFHDESSAATFHVEVSSGTTLLEAAVANGVPLPHECGGMCTCTTCHLLVKEGMEYIEPPSVREMHFLRRVDNRQQTSRLACQCLLKEGNGYLDLVIPANQ